ncbi:MAG: 4Fe-4S dicluster domain-containing protein [Dissulfurispiraceae bacterium]|jgi:anaerobic sulfite reductase subunit C
MRWTKEAEDAVARVPFFVRKRVRNRVEEEATRHGSQEVTIKHVGICQNRYLSNMEEEVAGFQVETCFGSAGCPNRAVNDEGIAEQIEVLLGGKNLRALLKERVKGPLKLHHEFRVSIADCPNACSRPQIADIGLIGASMPVVANSLCDGCLACLHACGEGAINLQDAERGPVIDYDKCLKCGKCCRVCPSGTLRDGQRGWRILIGGKLGRHPKLGMELCGIFSRDETLIVIEKAVDYYMAHSVKGERFGEVIDRSGLEVVEVLLEK